MSLNEGENAPSKSTKIEELHYVPEFHVEAKPAQQKDDRKGGKQRRGGKGGGDKKSSPWGLSPEEKAAKKGGPAAKPAKT
jgi:hypothetical protein